MGLVELEIDPNYAKGVELDGGSLVGPMGSVGARRRHRGAQR